MTLQEDDLSMHPSRVGACRLGAFRLGFLPKDIRADAASVVPNKFYVWDKHDTFSFLDARDNWSTERE